MTISSTTPRIQYVASGGQTVFTVPFKFFASSDLKVYLTPSGSDPDDSGQLKTLTTHYTVAGAGEDAGGTITLTSGATAGDIVTIVRDVPEERTTDLVEGGDLYAETLNDSLERFIAMVQEVNARVDRSLSVPESISDTVSVELPAPAGDTYLKWNSTGTALVQVNSDAGAGDSDAVTFVPEGTGAVARTAQAKLREQASVLDFGAAGDGTTDDTAAFQAAVDAASAAGGGRIIVPRTSAFYRITDTIDMADDVALVGQGDGSELKMDSASVALMFDFTGVSRAAIRNLKVNGNKTVVPASYAILLANAIECEITDCGFEDLPDNINGGIILSGTATRNVVARNRSLNAAGSFVGLTGSTVVANTVAYNEVTDCGGFGVFLGGGPSHNLVAFNRTRSNELELVGLTRGCRYNRVIGNHAEGCGDNGISITGDYNTVAGNICYANDLAGIWVWGSFNTVVGNQCINNNQVGPANTWSGIGISADFGGLGQYNTIQDNVFDDNQGTPTQNNGLRITNNTYTLWSSGVSVAANDYYYYGLNVYLSTGAGTTGATPPTHTSGTVSDGGVSWTYLATFLGEALPVGNFVGGNVYGRSVSTETYIQNASKQTLLTPDEVVFGGDGTTIVRVRGGSANSAALYFNGGSDSGRIVYDFSTHEMSFTANAAEVFQIKNPYVQFLRGMIHHRTGAGGNYTILTTDHIVGVTDTSTPKTINLPAAGRVAGMSFIIADESGGAGTNNITVSGNGANIDGAATHVISTNYGKVQVYWTGSQWKTH